MFTFDQLKAYCSVYEQGSYSAAARELSKDRTTIRELVTNLEDKLDVKLFTIQGRKAIPTTAGERLYLRATILFRQSLEFYSVAESAKVESLTDIVVAQDSGVPEHMAQFVEKKVSAQFPELRVHWISRTREKAIKEMAEDKVHIALMPGRGKIEGQELVDFSHLGGVLMKAYCRPSSLLAKRQGLTTTSLRLERQYVTEHHYKAGIMLSNVSIDVRLAPSYSAVIEMTKNRGWAAIPELLARPHVEAGELTELIVSQAETGAIVHYNAFFMHGVDKIPEVNQVLEWVKEYGQEYFV
ncbi:LysR family transcriptional regulator [Photobacterium satsumensis]|uniref:LysR family transcriptional regulator n=1 Tax=Photobacterium satsumensis TaxID=2910239 RepID=UPI003D0B7205